jgi:outer membrane lipoprotein-sorting protein
LKLPILIRLTATAVAVLLLHATRPVHAALKSAQMDLVQQVQAEGTNITITAKIWVKGEKVRMETRNPMMGEQIVILDDTSLYFLIPSQKAGQKGPPPMRDGKKATVWQLLRADVDALRARGKKVGRETVEGLACDVYVRNESKEGESRNVKAWIGTVQGTSVPMKVILKHTVSRPGVSIMRTQTMVIKNLKANVAVADSLFTVPKEYQIKTASGGRPAMPGIPGVP